MQILSFGFYPKPIEAQTQTQLNAVIIGPYTDKYEYVIGDLVTVQGIVINCDKYTNEITIKFYNPNNQIFHTKTIKLNNCSYKYSVQLGGALASPGLWTVATEYLDQPSAWNFLLIDNVQETRSINPVFNVKPSLTNGYIESIKIEPRIKNLIISVKTSKSKDGELVIILPRYLIDAKTDSHDDNFVVLVDGKKAFFDEVVITGIEKLIRILKIEVPAGTKEIEIIGTEITFPATVVPEFSLKVLFLSGLAVGGIVALGRKKLQNKKIEVM